MTKAIISCSCLHCWVVTESAGNVPKTFVALTMKHGPVAATRIILPAFRCQNLNQHKSTTMPLALSWNLDGANLSTVVVRWREKQKASIQAFRRLRKSSKVGFHILLWASLETSLENLQLS